MWSEPFVCRGNEEIGAAPSNIDQAVGRVVNRVNIRKGTNSVRSLDDLVDRNDGANSIRGVGERDDPCALVKGGIQA